MQKVKVILIGPKQCGKSILTNYLVDSSLEQPSGNYIPTRGCRIVEHEGVFNIHNKQAKVEIELWDASGDPKYENCWPAIQYGANGAILVFNPNQISHENEIEHLYSNFIKEADLGERNCLLVGIKNSPADDLSAGFRMPQLMENIICHTVSFSEEGNSKIRNEFHNFIENILRDMSERTEMEEARIINIKLD